MASAGHDRARPPRPAPVSAVPLPGDLRLQPVRRLPDDAPAGVPLEDAVAAVMLAEPRIDDPPEAFDASCGIAGRDALFAAVDGDRVVRATSGWECPARPRASCSSTRHLGGAAAESGGR